MCERPVWPFLCSSALLSYRTHKYNRIFRFYYICDTCVVCGNVYENSWYGNYEYRHRGGSSRVAYYVCPDPSTYPYIHRQHTLKRLKYNIFPSCDKKSLVRFVSFAPSYPATWHIALWPFHFFAVEFISIRAVLYAAAATAAAKEKSLAREYSVNSSSGRWWFFSLSSSYSFREEYVYFERLFSAEIRAMLCIIRFPHLFCV